MKRKMLAATMAAAMAASLAACGAGSSGSSSGASAASTQAATTAAAEATEAAASATESSAGASGDYTGVTLTMMDWGDSIQSYREAFNQEFIASHPGLTIDYQVLTTDQFNSNIASLVSSGDAPDIFYVPSTMTLAQCVSEGWLMDMTSYYSQDYLDTIDEASYSQGIGSIDGKVYGFNIVSPCNAMLLYYNQDVLDEAGVTKLPTTYSEFIDACKQVTEKTGGSAYGYVDGLAQTNRLDVLQRGLTGMAGGLDQATAATFYETTKDGAFVATEESKAAAEFLSDLFSAGVIHPDSATMNAPQAREYFASNKAAFICQGNWCISTWLEDHPDLNYGVCALPVPDGYTGKSFVFKQNGGNVMVVSAKSEHPDLAAEYIQAMNSYDSSFIKNAVGAGDLTSTVKKANDDYITDQHLKDYLALDDQYGVMVPNPVTYSTDANSLVAQVQSVSPDLGTIVQGIMTGSVAKSEIGSYLDTLNDALLAEWQRAADAAGVSVDCITVDDWQAGEDYTPAQ